jgi:phosphopantetheinyl transferase (holo-ACP synthase)
MSDPWGAIRAHAREQRERHAGALAWGSRIQTPMSSVWFDGELACTPDAELALGATLDRSEGDRIAAFMASPHPGSRRRGISAIHDRLALTLAIAELTENGERMEGHPRFRLAHTALGQPIVCGKDGSRAADLHVSFSHDGAAHLCVLAFAPDVRGVGVDVVHFPRLHGRSDDYLHRFALHFMSEEEYGAFARTSRSETSRTLLNRVCAHFSLMEAASKALGTGLRIGAGMGKKESLPKQSVGVSQIEPSIDWLLGSDARARCKELGASRLEGHWSVDEEYGVSVAILFR